MLCEPSGTLAYWYTWSLAQNVGFVYFYFLRALAPLRASQILDLSECWELVAFMPSLHR